MTDSVAKEHELNIRGRVAEAAKNVVEDTKDHIARYAKIQNTPSYDMEYLCWKNPRSSNYAIWFVANGPFLYISGDMGEAVFQWNEKISLAWVSGLTLDYYHSKCRASEVGARFSEWDPAVAQLRVREYIENEFEMREDVASRFDSVNGQDALVCQETWQAWCRDHADDVFGGDWYEGIGAPGEVIHYRCIWHLFALRLALKSLKERATKAENECGEGAGYAHAPNTAAFFDNEGELLDDD